MTFIEADMRDLEYLVAGGALQSSTAQHPFDPAGRFGLITCFGDAINYLTADDDPQRLFAGIRGALAPGGYVAFDVNTEAAFAQWDGRDVVIDESDDCLVYHRLAYNPVTRLGEGRIVWLTRSDDHRWRRGEETHIERAWSMVRSVRRLPSTVLRSSSAWRWTEKARRMMRHCRNAWCISQR